MRLGFPLPLAGLYYVSDRRRNPDGAIPAIEHDSVFPAIHRYTHEFLDVLPSAPCERLLDLCSGTAIAALQASTRYARHAWAVDLTERATHFAEFNRRLNGVENATILEGSVYAPVEGMTFDRIVAHPPYVPSRQGRALYADGGDDGERVTRAIVERLPQFLEPRGCLYCRTMGLDREGESFLERVRRWLGPDHARFDVMFVAVKTQGPLQFAYQTTRVAHGTWEEMDAWCAYLERLQVRRLSTGTLVIQSREQPGSAFTVRHDRGRCYGTAEIEWMRRWETHWAASGRAWVLDARPRLCPGVELQVVHARREGKLVPDRFTFIVARPFAVEHDAAPWVADLVNHCEGKSTLRELLATGSRDHWIPPEVREDDLVKAAGDLISRGILEVEGFEPPRD